MKKKDRLFHHVFETTFGYSAVVYRDSPFLLTRVLLPKEKASHLNACIVAEQMGISGSHPDALRVSDMICDYFNGVPLPWCWEILAMDGLTALHQKVLAATARIPYGAVRSYRQVATEIGRPRAYRFVGTTMARNPFPIIIPCHRVIKSDGTLGQFGGGVELKRKMIELEHTFRDGRTDLYS